MNKELINYIDFTSICEDNNLQTGDLPFHDQVTIEIILQRFIDSNRQIESEQYTTNNKTIQKQNQYFYKLNTKQLR